MNDPSHRPTQTRDHPASPGPEDDSTKMTGALECRFARLKAVDAIRDRFQAAWLTGGPRPQLEDYLNEQPHGLYRDLLGVLLECEIEQRQVAGETFERKEYELRFPRDVDLVRQAFREGNEPAGDCEVGGYEIQGELGRGGMGVVYRARQLGLNRTVALKMVLAGGRASPDELQRFQAEAEVIAGLQHPHIVQIHEVGEHQGRPYFSLEFVTGGTLAQRIQRQLLLPHQAATLVRSLAEAMDAAHRQGVIHRDLKPGNVLLTGEPEDPLEQCVAKITDFGLAKRVELGSGMTQEGALLGTPSYMAPEQAQGLVSIMGPAADVYALGAILYECLTGRPPFKGTSTFDTIRQVVVDEPVPPRQLQPKVPRDLETICLKCLHKEPGKRYGSAGDLAEDLGRFLAGEPIRARATSAVERAWKWARRRPTVAALWVLGMLAPLLLGAGGLLYAWQEHHLRQVAESHRREANRQRVRAEENLQRSQEVIRYLANVGHQRLAHVPHMELLRREMLLKSLAFHQQFLKINKGEPRQEGHIGQTYLFVGEIQEMLGQRKAAVKAYRKAVATLTPLTEQFPEEITYRRHLARAWNDLAILYHATQPDDVEQAFAQALTLKRQLVADPGEAEDLLALAKCYNARCLHYHTQGKRQQAERDVLEAIRVLKAPGAQTSQEMHETRAQGYLNLAVILTEDRPQKAEEEYQQALEIYQTLAHDHQDEPRYQHKIAEVYHNRGTLRHLGKQAAKASEDYQEAAQILTELVKRFPAVMDYRHQLATTSRNRGQLLLELRRGKEAVGVWRRTVEELQELGKTFPDKPEYQRELGLSLNSLAIALVLAQQPKEAIPIWRKAIQVQDKLLADFPTRPDFWKEALESLDNLIQLLKGSPSSQEADKACRKWLAEMAQNWAAACLVQAEKLQKRGHEKEANGWRQKATQLQGQARKLASTPAATEHRR